MFRIDFSRVRGNPVRFAWDRLSSLPGGRVVFSRMIGRMAPYTGTVGAVFEELGEGHGRAVLEDRPGVRNHLQSIHAVALMNLGEVTTGAAVMYSLPGDARGIVTGMHMQYLKKARGRITAICDHPIAPSNRERSETVTADIVDEAGDVVARFEAEWKIGPMS